MTFEEILSLLKREFPQYSSEYLRGELEKIVKDLPEVNQKIYSYYSFKKLE